MLGFAVGCWLGGGVGEARASYCFEGNRFYPYRDAVVGTDAQIWLRAEIGSGLPHLEHAAGSEVKLVRVEQREINHEWWGHYSLQRFSPVMPLEPGEYWLSFEPPPDRNGLVAARHAARHATGREGTPFRVVGGAEQAPVTLPVQRGLNFLLGPSDSGAGGAGSTGVLASFELSLAQGMLVADFGDADDDPIESLYFEPSRNGDRIVFLLGSSTCESNLRAAPCAHTRIRFGALSASGRFSGWTRSSEIEFPGENCALPISTGVAQPGWRSLAFCGALVVAAALIAGRFARRRTR